MKIETLGEHGLIASIRARGLARPAGVVRGIGDDAAVFRLAPGRVAVVTTDMLLEDVHFRLRWSEPAALGARAIAVNLSDIAAMGAVPREVFVGLALPAGFAVDVVEQIIDGMHAAAARYAVNLLGGDTSVSRGGLVLAITLVGEAEADAIVYRSGALAGDQIYVTGTVGDAAAGLALLESGPRSWTAAEQLLVNAQLAPHPFVAEGQHLAASGAVRAMIDLSDGLASDLGQILAESGEVGATIEGTRLPLSAALRAVAPALGRSAHDLALGGGDDYRLLAVVRPERAAELEQSYHDRFGAGLRWIGTIDAESGLRLRDGSGVAPLAAVGYRHFGEGSERAAGPGA